MFNNINSQDMGVLNCSISSGLYEEPFIGTKNIIQETIRGRSQPYFMGVETESKEFDLTLALPENFTTEQLREIARWLETGFFVPLVFSDDPEKIYYCMLQSDSQIHHTGNNGYLTVSMLCNSQYSYSPVYSSSQYDLSSNPTTGQEIILTNNGDVDCHLLTTIQVINGGSFSIVNKSDGGKSFSMTSIGDLETITINTENESVQSDLPFIYRIDNITSGSKFFTVPRGVNHLQIFGNVKMQIKYEQRFIV